MLRDRKYKTIPPLTIPEINFEKRMENNFIAYKGESSGIGENTHLYFPEYETLGSDAIRNITAYIETNDVDRIVIMVKLKVSPVAQAIIKELCIQKRKVEVFFEKDLQYNISKHSYVPQHIICTEATKKEVMKQYNVTASQMIKMQSTDAMAKWLGAQPGQMIKILRPSDYGNVCTDQPLYDISYALVYENHSKTTKGVEKKRKKK
jgi:DNA-directed RNA polymerase subunit H (RpoH/RPB5)